MTCDNCGNKYHIAEECNGSCPDCHGYGYVAQPSPKVGGGEVVVYPQGVSLPPDCPSCGGTGKQALTTQGEE